MNMLLLAEVSIKMKKKKSDGPKYSIGGPILF